MTATKAGQQDKLDQFIDAVHEAHLILDDSVRIAHALTGVPMPETWRDIPGWEGFYQASTLGRIRSVDRTTNRGHRTRGRVLRPGLNKAADHPGASYNAVCLYRGGRGTRVKATVHSLIALTFHGPRPQGMEVCHNNGNPRDNRAVNLRYDSPRENYRDTARHQRHARRRRRVLERLERSGNLPAWEGYSWHLGE